MVEPAAVAGKGDASVLQTVTSTALEGAEVHDLDLDAAGNLWVTVSAGAVGFAGVLVFGVHFATSICERKNSRTLSTANNRFPRSSPRRRKLTPLIEPSAKSVYARLLLIPKRACSPAASRNSGSVAGDAVAGAVD